MVGAQEEDLGGGVGDDVGRRRLQPGGSDVLEGDVGLDPLRSAPPPSMAVVKRTSPSRASTRQRRERLRTTVPGA